MVFLIRKMYRINKCVIPQSSFRMCSYVAWYKAWEKYTEVSISVAITSDSYTQNLWQFSISSETTNRLHNYDSFHWMLFRMLFSSSSIHSYWVLLWGKVWFETEIRCRTNQLYRTRNEFATYTYYIMCAFTFMWPCWHVKRWRKWIETQKFQSKTVW